MVEDVGRESAVVRSRPRSLSPWLWLTLLAVALVVRRFTLFYWQDRAESGFGFPDSESYWYLARQILAGGDYEFGTPDARIFRTPGYPVLLAGWLGIGQWLGPMDGVSALIWARGLSVILGLLTLVVVVRFTKRTLGRRTALVAGLLVALHPECVFPSVLLLSEQAFALTATLFAVALFELLRTTSSEPFRPTPNPARSTSSAGRAWNSLEFFPQAALLGWWGGLATLIHPSWLPAVPLTAAWAWLRPATRPQAARITVWLVGVWALVMLPWWMRNAWLTGSFVATTLQTGASLYDGWNPRATGASDMRFVPEFKRQLQLDRAAAEARRTAFADYPPGKPLPADVLAAQALLARPPEVELDRRMGQAASAWAWSHPWRVLELAVIKVLRTWNPSLNESDLASTTLKWGLILINVLFWAAAAVGLRNIRRRPALWMACLFPAVFLTCLHTVAVGSVRYRLPAVPCLCVLAAAALAPAHRAAAPRDRRRPVSDGPAPSAPSSAV